MELFNYTVTALASAVTNPTTIIMMFVLGFLFYSRNKKIAIMQKLIIGEEINSALEMTISQIVLGIFVGLIASVLMSFVGVVFTNLTSIFALFVISILLNFIKPRFICFSYSGAVLGIISIVTQYILNNEGTFHIDIMCLLSFIGIMHIVEAFLVFFDGDRGAIPVFSKNEDKIRGGYTLNRSWILPIAIMIAVKAIDVSMTVNGETIATPDWWPLMNTNYVSTIIATMLIGIQTFFGIIGYSSVTFSRTKKEKKRSSGIFILVYGIIIICIGNIAQLGPIWEIVSVILTPILHEVMLVVQRIFESRRESIFVSDDEGISILEVVPKSQFDELGVRAGDKIVSIDEVEVKSEEEIYKIAKSNFNSLKIKIKTISGQIKDITITEKHENGFRILLVPKNIKKEMQFSEVLHKIKDDIEQ